MDPQTVSYGYRYFLMALIIAINAFFSSAELALVSVRASRLKQMAIEGVVGAQAALSLTANPERLLSVTQVGLTLASLALGWLGESTLHGSLMSLFGAVDDAKTHAAVSVVSLVLAFLIMTFTHVVAGEVVPKNVAFEKADRLAILAAPILLVFYKVVEPFCWVIERAAAAVSGLLGVHGHQHGAHSPEELKFVVSASQAAGHLTEFEESAIRNIVDLQEYNVREVMVPRNRFITVNVTDSIDVVLERMSESRYSRLPVCPKPGDNPIGFVHVKDVLEYWVRLRHAHALNRAAPKFHTLSILRKAPIVPESRPLHLVLDDLRDNHAHVAFVVDEFGSVSGLISLEDVLEQVFGEIQDEFDVEAAPPEASESFEVEGTIPIRDLETQYGVEIPTGDDFETLAGYILFRLGHIPEAGEQVEYADYRFTVVRMEFHLIASVRVDHVRTKPIANG